MEHNKSIELGSQGVPSPSVHLRLITIESNQDLLLFRIYYKSPLSNLFTTFLTTLMSS